MVGDCQSGQWKSGGVTAITCPNGQAVYKVNATGTFECRSANSTIASQVGLPAYFPDKAACWDGTNWRVIWLETYRSNVLVSYSRPQSTTSVDFNWNGTSQSSGGPCGVMGINSYTPL